MSTYSTFFLSSLIAFLCLSNQCLCFKPKHFNLSDTATHWGPASATWYGSRDGAGSDGGAYGYGSAVSAAPFSSMITAISPSLYKSGKECGACYLVKCTRHPSCSGKPARVVITDSGPALADSAHFDLSGTAFGAMAIPGQEENLLNAGTLQILYARVACDYAGKTIAFHVDQGSNPNYIAVVVEFEEGDGDLAGVGLMEESKARAGNEWRRMQQSWGAVWKLDAGSELKPPLSIKLTSQYSGESIVAKDVIPAPPNPPPTPPPPPPPPSNKEEDIERD